MNKRDEAPEEEEEDIIEELHRIRWAIFEEAGGTPEAYGQHYVDLDKKRLAAEKAAREKQEKPAKPARRAAASRSGNTGKRRSKVTVS